MPFKHILGSDHLNEHYIVTLRQMQPGFHKAKSNTICTKYHIYIYFGKLHFKLKLLSLYSKNKVHRKVSDSKLM